MRITLIVEFILAGYLIVLLRPQLIPERFSRDGLTIQRIAQGNDANLGDSYTVVAEIYRLLGLAYNGTLASLLGYTLAVAVILLVARRCRGIETGLWVTVMQIVAILFASVYLGVYSKDVFVLVITLAVLLAPRKLTGDLLIVALIWLYSDTLRSYWLITMALYVVIRIVYSKRMLLRPVLITGLSLLVVVSLAITVTQGVSADYYRQKVNEFRVGTGEAATLIAPFVSLPEPIGGVVNNVLTLVTLVCPFPLVKLGSPYYLFLAAMIFFMWVAFFRALKHTEGATELPVTFRRAVSLVIAFLLTQAVFEPDYGSVLRHITPLMPLMLYVVWHSQPRALAWAAGRAARLDAKHAPDSFRSRQAAIEPDEPIDPAEPAPPLADADPVAVPGDGPAPLDLFRILRDLDADKKATPDLSRVLRASDTDRRPL